MASYSPKSIKSLSPDQLSCHTGVGVPVIRLSDMYGKDWSSNKNKFSNPAMVDYALSAPFQLFSGDIARILCETGELYYDSEYEYSTARTSSCIRGAPDLVKIVDRLSDNLEAMASRLVGGGVQMRVSNSIVDKAHLNVERHVQTKPVDNWHQDSTPFVLVSILTDHTSDSGGHLMVRHGGDEHRYKLRVPGQAVFMQGSQVWHMAQQSEVGKRLTLVTYFYVEDAMVYDSTSLRAALEYSPPVIATVEFLQHALHRLIKNAETSRQLSITSCASSLQVNHIMVNEIAKLVNEYETGFALIPGTHKEDTGLNDV